MKITVLIIILSINLSCSSPNENDYHVNQLADIKITAEKISKLRSLIIAHKDSIVLECYYNGVDQNFKDDIMSTTKSITSLLIGIALDKGFIKDVDQTLSDFLPDSLFNDDRKKKITIDQLLMMSSGLSWDSGSSNEYLNWVHSDDQLHYILNKAINHRAGIDFNYSDGASHLLSVIISKSTGFSALEFAKEYLFGLLEINDFQWIADNRGYNYGGTRLYLKAIDMLKIAKLLKNNGVHNGKNIISSDWLNLSTSKKMYVNNQVDYAYQWWIKKDISPNYIYASGHGGQFIVAIPELELSIVATSNWNFPDNIAQQNWLDVYNLINNKIIPTFK